MADNKTELPEGTDKVIAGASATASSNSGPGGNVDGGTGGSISGTGAIGSGAAAEEALTSTGAATAPEAFGGTGRGGTAATVAETASPADSTAGGSGGMMEKVRSGGEKLSGQAAEKARGLVGQGLERSSEALTNVSRMIGDTADGIDERLGKEYGDYARRAASAIESTANSLATKDPDELIDDTREFVRRSPGIALAGAAIVGFALARLIKTGLATGGEGSGPDRGGGRDTPA